MPQIRRSMSCVGVLLFFLLIVTGGASASTGTSHATDQYPKTYRIDLAPLPLKNGTDAPTTGQPVTSSYVLIPLSETHLQQGRNPKDYEPLCLLTAAIPHYDYQTLFDYYWHLDGATLNQCNNSVTGGYYYVTIEGTCAGLFINYDSFTFSSNPLGKGKTDRTTRGYATSPCILHGVRSRFTLKISIFSQATLGKNGISVASDSYQTNITLGP